MATAWRSPHTSDIMTAAAARKARPPGPGAYDVRRSAVRGHKFSVVATT